MIDTSAQRLIKPGQNPAWRWRHLYAAPHRLAFTLAFLVILSASLWWSVVQMSRLGIGPTLPLLHSPSLTHAIVMVFGFFPLLFAGFLFTAGPKWLGVSAPSAQQIAPGLQLQALGWIGWLVGASASSDVALTGLAMVIVGWMISQLQFFNLVRRSMSSDRIHAHSVVIAGWMGVGSLVAAWWSLLLGHDASTFIWVRTGLWLSVVITFLTVIHRMLPFFTSSALPSVQVWRPRWVLWFFLALSVVEAVFIWWLKWIAVMDSHGPRVDRGWMLAMGLLEMAGGSVVLCLSLCWGLMQSLKVRLLAMLHIGFVWFGLALLLSGASSLLGIRNGTPVLGLGSLHALTLGFLGSVTMAMVTRVSSGHSGRPLSASSGVWALFSALQMVAVLRIVSAWTGAPAWLNPLVSCLWLLVMLLWAIRLVYWYGTPRVDGQPG